MACLPPGAPGLTASRRSGRRSGFCGAPWSSSLTLRLPALDAAVPLVDVLAFVEEQKKQEDARMDQLEDMMRGSQPALRHP